MMNVAVRKGLLPDERWLSFPDPPRIAVLESLLADGRLTIDSVFVDGWAFDGARILRSVQRQDLRQMQLHVKRWLEERLGETVGFV